MNRNILITGGNSGIGREMASTLAELGNRVIIASRDQNKSQTEVFAIRKALNIPGREVDIDAMPLDLSNFDNIDRFSDDILKLMPTIDVLILNAGLYTHRLRTLDNGLEAMVGIMHFGHFRLVRNLLDAVKTAADGRIVVTSSMSHKFGRIDEKSFTDPDQHKLAFSAYAQAKLANLLFTRQLAVNLQGSPVTANAFHPGAVSTGIWTELPKPAQALISPFLINTKKGADTAIWLASSREAKDYNGEYFVKRKIAMSTRTSKDMKLAQKLWSLTEARM